MTKDDHWYKCLELAADHMNCDFIAQMLWDAYPEIVWC
jgi:hypothetical protein